MFVVVTGGSGSGKSAFAEQQVVDSDIPRRYYAATMICSDEESRKRVERHRAMRSGKHFSTIECPRDLDQICVEEGSALLLECMSNLTANEFFADGRIGESEKVKQKILSGIRRLMEECALLVVVTNEVFSDGNQYDSIAESYLKCLGEVNQEMAKLADEVVEVVYGIPLYLKRDKTE